MSDPRVPLDILLCSPGIPHWGGILQEKSLGGSETAAIYVAEALARLGHFVQVFSPCPQPVEVRGVLYRPLQDYLPYAAGTPHDIAIVSRDLNLARMHVQAGAVILWCHDLALKRNRPFFVSALWNLRSIFVLSEFQRMQYAEIHGPVGSVLHVTRNGINLAGIAPLRTTPRDMTKLVYGSRPERGLEAALNVMQILGQRGSPLKLSVSYYDNTTQELASYYNMLFQRAQSMPNVKLLGPLKQQDWWRELAGAAALIYPGCNGDFAEISCLNALEAQAVGTPVVSLCKGAIPETLGAKWSDRGEWDCPPGLLVGQPEQDVNAGDYLNTFADAVQSVASGGVRWERMHRQGIQRSANMSWDAVAAEWDAHFRSILSSDADDVTRRKALARLGDHEAANGNGADEAAA